VKVVVTGASGFIGSAVVKDLIATGKEVCVLVRPESKVLGTLAKGIKEITYVLLSDELLLDNLKAWKPDVMINIAWKGVGGSERSEGYQFIDNITYTMQSIKLAANAGCKQWIGTGSQAEYGIYNTRISENFSCNPVTAYGKAKLAAGIAALGMCESLNIKGTWARIFSVYGPGDHPQTFINYTIKSLLNNQAPVLTPCVQKWDYLYITDAAAAIVSLAQNNCSGVYNIGSGGSIILREVVEQLKRNLEFKGEIIFGLKGYSKGQLMHLEADVEKLKQDTKWKALVSIQEGLIQTVLSMQENFIYESI
jgi:UDP-glucose 4-epimerase